MRKYIDFYKKGLFLVNANIPIYFASLFFVLGMQINSIAKSLGITQNPFINILSIIFIILSLGSVFLDIKTLYDVSEKNKLTFILIEKNYKNTFIRSARIMLLLMFFIGCVGIIMMNPKNSFLRKAFYSLPGLSAILVITVPFSIYFSIFFAVKNKSFADSFLQAFYFYKKNVSFICIAICYSFVSWILINVSPLNIVSRPPFSYIYLVINNYTDLILKAALLLYFKEKYNEGKIG